MPASGIRPCGRVRKCSCGAAVATSSLWEPGSSTAPDTNSWSVFDQGPLEARSGHTAVWTGTEMLVWGGSGAGDFSRLSNGAAYNPTTKAWTLLSDPPPPLSDGRILHSAVWTGTTMVIWGGESSGTGTATGGVFDPSTDTWTVP